MQVKSNGIAINCRIDGPEGAPWLIWSNSLATNLDAWEQQASEFKSTFRILRYDQRGHGATDAPAGRYSFETLIADALGLMAALAIPKAHFAGLSMGGATALGLAEKHPEWLDRVIVCDSGCQSSPASAQQWEERIAIAQKQGMEPLIEPTITRWFPPDVIKANPACAAALADHNYADAVGTVRRPVLFLVGEKDGVTPAAMRKLHERLPGSRYVELAGAGHISNLDRPEGFNRAVGDFLRGG